METRVRTRGDTPPRSLEDDRVKREGIAWFRRFGGVAIVTLGFISPTWAQQEDGGWTHWGANASSTRYAPFDQIDADNFADLEVAWVWRGDTAHIRGGASRTPAAPCRRQGDGS